MKVSAGGELPEGSGDGVRKGQRRLFFCRISPVIRQSRKKSRRVWGSLAAERISSNGMYRMMDRRWLFSASRGMAAVRGWVAYASIALPTDRIVCSGNRRFLG
jgi:hypothetical protein